MSICRYFGKDRIVNLAACHTIRIEKHTIDVKIEKGKRTQKHPFDKYKTNKITTYRILASGGDEIDYCLKEVATYEEAQTELAEIQEKLDRPYQRRSRNKND